MASKAVREKLEAYFSEVNPTSRRMMEDIKTLRQNENWDSLDDEEQAEYLWNNLAPKDLERMYGPAPNNENEVFPILSISSGEKLVIDEKTSSDRPFGCSWKDEHSSPFTWHTKSQLNLHNLTEESLLNLNKLTSDGSQTNIPNLAVDAKSSTVKRKSATLPNKAPPPVPTTGPKTERLKNLSGDCPKKKQIPLTPSNSKSQVFSTNSMPKQSSTNKETTNKMKSETLRNNKSSPILPKKMEKKAQNVLQDNKYLPTSINKELIESNISGKQQCSDIKQNDAKIITTQPKKAVIASGAPSPIKTILNNNNNDDTKKDFIHGVPTKLVISTDGAVAMTQETPNIPLKKNVSDVVTPKKQITKDSEPPKMIIAPNGAVVMIQEPANISKKANLIVVKPEIHNFKDSKKVSDVIKQQAPIGTDKISKDDSPSQKMSPNKIKNDVKNVSDRSKQNIATSNVPQKYSPKKSNNIQVKPEIHKSPNKMVVVEKHQIEEIEDEKNIPKTGFDFLDNW